MIAAQYQLLPSLSEDEYATLKADIRERGVMVPVELDERGQVLDGHHRIRAWGELRAEGCRVEDFPRLIRAGLSEEEKVARVLALNLYRRHLNRDQRAELIATLKQLGWSNPRIAEAAGVSTPTVWRDSKAGCSDEQPARHVVGKDGRRQSATKIRKPTTVLATTARTASRVVQELALIPPEERPTGLVAPTQIGKVARPYRPEHAVSTQDLAVPAGVRLEVADAVALPLDDQSIDLIVTSPPYGLEVDYHGGDVDPSEWPDWMARWLVEAYRVTRDGGRLALNVPLDTTRGGIRPTYAEAVSAALVAGWSYRWTIVWAERNVSRSVARGSVASPSAPHVISPVEMVAVFYRGDWKRESAQRPDLTGDEWLAWTDGLWSFSGEGRAWEGHPAPFPEELPRRLIKLLSFPGDVVLDPMCGSGTTVLVAHQLGRDAIGFDISQRYAASARRRIAAAL